MVKPGSTSGRGAFTLVEILIAGTVLALVIVPLIGLMTSRKTDQQSEEGMSEAVAMCQDMMEKIVSNNLPFQAIDPGGGGSYVKGGSGGSVSQAGFRDVPYPVRGQTFRKSDLDPIINDGDATLPDGTYRSKKVKGKVYYVSFFAGKYPDRSPIPDPRESGYTMPDFEKTLTFVYHPNHAGFGEPFNFTDADRQKFNKQVILDTAKVNIGGTEIETVPYSTKSYLVTGGSSPKAESFDQDKEYFYHDKLKTLPSNRQGWGLICGWPDPRYGSNGDSSIVYDLNDAKTNQQEIWARHLTDVVTGVKKPNVAYHPVVLDQRTFKATNGSLMKIILGVKFSPYGYSALRKAQADAMREFWLVSFKANVED